MTYKAKFNINAVCCPNCNQFKITPISRYMFIMAMLCCIFIITFPLALIFFLLGLKLVYTKKPIQKYACANCQKKFTQDEVEKIFY